MPRPSAAVRVFLAIALALAVSPALAKNSAPQAFERPYNLLASRILPGNLLSGPHHRVEEAVENDGMQNIYTVRSRFGSYRVKSTALLAIRVGEFAAMAAMDRASGAEEFGKGIFEGGASLVRGVANLVTEPAETLQGAASGVGKLFSRADESLEGTASSRYEDSAGAALSGFAATRRSLALTFGVDPYSTNQPLRDKLVNLATGGYAGDMTTVGLKALIPGGVGIAVGSVGGVSWLGQVDLAQPPSELRIRNRKALADMRVPAGAAWAFMNDSWYTPTQQALLVKGLSSISFAGNKEAFLRAAAQAADQDQALLCQRTAVMYAGYNRVVDVVRGFVGLPAPRGAGGAGRADTMAAAMTGEGRLVLCLPVDHLCWTRETADLAARVDGAVERLKPLGVELWVSGTVSRQARQALAARGWSVRERAGKELLGETF